MKIIDHMSMRASRVYFTEFDRVTYSQVAWTENDIEEILTNMERKLKLVSMIKGHVVIAASHLLESELAIETLLQNPRLFSDGVIVPALRSEYAGFEDFLDSKLAEGREAAQYEGSERREMAQMLDSHVSMAVRWEADKASAWFKERLLSDIGNDGSLLGASIRKCGAAVTPKLISTIREKPLLSRGDVYIAAKETGDKNLWHILSEYADFIYYLSGARAVGSEGVLPQENMVDFSLVDLSGGHTNLSDMAVFFKLFVDIVKEATNTHFPVDFLDALTVEDILDLHALAVESRFVDKYNLIQERTKQGLEISDPDRLVLLMEELEQYERDLHSEFAAAVRREMPRYQRDARNLKNANFMNATANLIVPAWGAVTGAKEILVSGLEAAGLDGIVGRARKGITGRLDALANLIDRTAIEDKPVLLNFVKHMQRRYSGKMLDA